MLELLPHDGMAMMASLQCWFGWFPPPNWFGTKAVSEGDRLEYTRCTRTL